jgi:RimJ/RimL family protein N-acetyltransferase
MRLCPYGEADLALTTALETDPVVMRHLGGAAGADRALAVHRKRLAGAAAGDWYRTIVPGGAAEPVGLVGVWRTPWEGREIHEFGVMFRPEHQRRGMGVAAGRMLFDELRAAGAVRRVHAFSSVGNEGAARGCRRLGFALAGDCDLDYEGAPLRCHHWVRDLTGADGQAG